MPFAQRSSFNAQINSRHYRQRQRLHQSSRSRNLSSTLFKATTSAAAIYATYQLASWAWTQFCSDDNNNDENEDKKHHEKFKTIENEEEAHNNISNNNIPKPPTTTNTTNTNHPIHPNERKRRIQKCRQETISAMMNFLPTLKKSIDVSTDSSKETKILKELRKRKKTQLSEKDTVEPIMMKDREEELLWERIKVQSLTKVMCTAYAHSLLFLVLTVQVHLLGRGLYDLQKTLLLQGEEKKKEGKSTHYEQEQEQEHPHHHHHDAEEILKQGQKSHAIVLQKTYSYFFQTGIPELCQTIQTFLERRRDTTSNNDSNNRMEMTSPLSMKCWDMMNEDGIKIHEFQKGIADIRSFMEGPQHEPNPQHLQPPSHHQQHKNSKQCENPDRVPLLLSFMIQDQTNTSNPPIKDIDLESNREAHYILNQTWDIVESPIFYTALEECVNYTFDRLWTEYWEPLFPSTFVPDETTVTNEESKTRTNATSSIPPSSLTMPLVQIITKMKHSSNSFHKLRNHQRSFGISELGNMKDMDNSMNQFPNEYLPFLQSLHGTMDLGDLSFTI